MKRRVFLTAAAGLPVATAAGGAGGKLTLSEKGYFRVVQIDPRLITKTIDTIAVGYGKAKSDVIASAYLSIEESAKLRKLLVSALTDSTDVPGCGHSPAYVIVHCEGGKAVDYVSVCGLCMTWCGPNGELRVLDGAILMPALTKLLPLPPALAKVKKLPDLLDLDGRKSHRELPSPPEE